MSHWMILNIQCTIWISGCSVWAHEHRNASYLQRSTSPCSCGRFLKPQECCTSSFLRVERLTDRGHFIPLQHVHGDVDVDVIDVLRYHYQRANLNSTDDNGLTALHYTVFNIHASQLVLLSKVEKSIVISYNLVKRNRCFIVVNQECLPMLLKMLLSEKVRSLKKYLKITL